MTMKTTGYCELQKCDYEIEVYVKEFQAMGAPKQYYAKTMYCEYGFFNNCEYIHGPKVCPIFERYRSSLSLHKN